MLKVRDGDLDKLGLLFQRYNRRLFGFFFRLTARRDVSEDLVQGVFERILKYRETYTANGSFATWIFRIARNLHADYHRESTCLEQRHESVEWDQVPGNGLEPGQTSNETFKQQLLEQGIERLDPVKRQTLVLSRFEGFRYREIAEIMDCTESAVKVRIYRALRELKEIITELREKEEI